MSPAEGIGEVFNRDVQFVLIAPVVIDQAIGGIDGPIESVFAIVVPDRGSTNESDRPESSAGIAVRVLLPLLRVDSNCLPKALLRLGHPRIALTDPGEQRGFGYWFPVRHRCLTSEADRRRARTRHRPDVRLCEDLATLRP